MVCFLRSLAFAQSVTALVTCPELRFMERVVGILGMMGSWPSIIVNIIVLVSSDIRSRNKGEEGKSLTFTLTAISSPDVNGEGKEINVV